MYNIIEPNEEDMNNARLASILFVGFYDKHLVVTSVLNPPDIHFFLNDTQSRFTSLDTIIKCAGLLNDSHSIYYKEFLLADKKNLSLRAYKVKTGFFSICWVCNISLHFNNKQMYVDSLSSKYQSKLWGQAYSLLKTYDGFQLYKSTEEAVNAYV
jgi:hypothetical protein